MQIDFTDRALYVDWIDEIADAMRNPSVRYIFLKWWAWAGKSYAVVQLLIQEMLDGVRVGIFRKVSRTLKASCLQLMKDVVSDFGLGKYVECKESKDIITPSWLGMMFWMDDPEKIKSIASFDWFWIEETTELTFEDFTQLDLRLRWWKNHKIICSFNPVSSRHRLKKEIYDKPSLWENAVWIEKTARDNRFVWEEYLRALNELRYKNEAKWRIYALNEWWEWTKWSVFPQYNIFSHDIKPDSIGLDFWFNDPNALTYISIEDKGEKKDIYIQEKIYSTGQTSQDLIDEMDNIGVPKDVLIIADSARPEMIADISKAWYRIQGVKKYKNSKNEQIDNVKQYNIYINWPHIVEEFAEYSWVTDKKTWESLDIPEDGNDHVIDSALYGATYFKRGKVMALFW